MVINTTAKANEEARSMMSQATTAIVLSRVMMTLASRTRQPETTHGLPIVHHLQSTPLDAQKQCRDSKGIHHGAISIGHGQHPATHAPTCATVRTGQETADCPGGTMPEGPRATMQHHHNTDTVKFSMENSTAAFIQTPLGILRTFGDLVQAQERGRNSLLKTA